MIYDLQGRRVADGQSVSTLGEGAFWQSALATISGCQGLTEIAPAAFSETDITSFELNPYVTTVGIYAFLDCKNLQQVKLNDGLTTIGAYAFNGCTSLVGIDLPESVTALGEAAFWQCHALKQVTLSPQLTAIAPATFLECMALTELTLPEAVETIGHSALGACSKLQRVSLGSQLKTVGPYAFAYSDALTSLRVAAATPPAVDETTFTSYNATLTVPDASVDLYRAADSWKEFSIAGVAEGINAGRTQQRVVLTRGGLVLPSDVRTVSIFTTDGRLVATLQPADGFCSLNMLPQGQYMAVVNMAGGNTVLKIAR